MSIRETVGWLAGLGLVAALPVLSVSLDASPTGPLCALDGVPVPEMLNLRAIDDDGTVHAFCSFRCGASWLAGSGSDPTLLVRDEASGRDIHCVSAWYVRSVIPTARVTGERIHAFSRRRDAEAHAAAHAGRLLSKAESPLGLGP